jgi:hypothetical protein
MMKRFPRLALMAFVLMAAFVSGGIAADKTPARFSVVFELRDTGELPQEERFFALKTGDTLYGVPKADWDGNCWYGALMEDGKVRFENVKRGHYVLLQSRAFMGMFVSEAQVGEYDLNKEVTIPLELPRMRTCKVWLTMPPGGKASEDKGGNGWMPQRAVEVRVESHTGKARGYRNVLRLQRVGERIGGEWDSVPESGGTFQLKFVGMFDHNPYVDLRVADITLTPKMVASGVIQFRYARKKSPAR